MKNNILKFELKIEDEKNKFRIVYENGEWKGTPGTNGKETAKEAILFLQQYI